MSVSYAIRIAFLDCRLRSEALRIAKVGATGLILYIPSQDPSQTLQGELGGVKG